MRKWLKENIFVKDMFLYILIGALIFYIPAWVSFILGLVFNIEILLAFSAAYVLIWAGPLTPTIPVIFSIAIAIKQLVKKMKKLKE